MPILSDDQYYDFLDWLDNQSADAFSKSTNKDDYGDEATRERLVGARWAYDKTMEYLDDLYENREREE